MLPPEAIKEFQAISQKTHGVSLDDAEALKQATNLFNLFKVIYQPIKK